MASKQKKSYVCPPKCESFKVPENILNEELEVIRKRREAVHCESSDGLDPFWWVPFKRYTMSPNLFKIVLCDLLKNHKNEKSESFLARSFLLKMLHCAARGIIQDGSLTPFWIWAILHKQEV